MARLAGGVRQMELGVEAIPVAGAQSGVWDLLLQALADSGGTLDMLQTIDSTIIQSANRCAAGKKTEEQKSGTLAVRAVGSAPKIHVRCNAAGLPIGVLPVRARPMTRRLTTG